MSIRETDDADGRETIRGEGADDRTCVCVPEGSP